MGISDPTIKPVVKSVSCTVPLELWQKLQFYAAQRGVPVSQVMQEILIPALTDLLIVERADQNSD